MFAFRTSFNRLRGVGIGTFCVVSGTVSHGCKCRNGLQNDVNAERVKLYFTHFHMCLGEYSVICLCNNSFVCVCVFV
ncbi:hypothetical protein, unlikely [Trypanosoma brucei brucei TREU927]|uniref:Uncharacterized protein n=1 Tax=Trypanosoma brucei brucei (strain 927/4 GUTat10.1) TaxID=185431 RepID=Q38CS7_TRYB2|nr:hypothetical protein, unlikely [Trypanosoma brucei brucei TREU927]EAN77393.1 hypothetical protein, unlikely [Trypanosoma brucei brucei TREU927]